VTVFAGHYGSIELKRKGDPFTLDLAITRQDISFNRKRFALSTPEGGEIPFGSITTGDRVRIETKDSRGLPFRFFTNAANTAFVDFPKQNIGPLEFFANVDAMGAIRMYRSFASAIANSNSNYLAVPLQPDVGSEPWSVKVTLLPGAYNTLGRVESFTLSTERENIDTTSLGDRFRGFSASAISGGGTVDCLFEFKNVVGQEIPAALAELIQKVEIGSRFDGKFYLLKPGLPQPPGYTAIEGAYYEVEGMLTRSAVTVAANQIVECSFDFITTGDFVFRTGDSPVEITTEAGVRIGNDTNLEDLGLLREID
jgi:hypothetical protein